MSATVTEDAFTTRDVPWMKLGTVIDKAIPSAEAMKKAKLDFKVELRPVHFANKKGELVRFEGRSVIARVGTDQPFGVASDDYEIVQYAEAFAFIDGISPEIVAAGPLKNGRQAFMVCKAPGHVELDVIDGDKHELFVVLRTSHDCSKAVEVFLMPLRGMCMNQLPLKSIGRNAQQSWSVRHVSTAKEKLAQAQSVLVGLDSYAAEFNEIAKRLADIDINVAEAEEMLQLVLPDRPKRQEAVEAITGLLDHGYTIGDQFHRTGWGLVNAVGEYFEHHRRGASAESRFTNGLSGSTNRYVNRTAQLLIRR